MKKNYILSTIFSFIVLSTMAQTTSTDPTFVITKLNTPENAEGVVYKGTIYDAEIEVNLRNVTPRVMPGQFSIYCLDAPNSFTDYPYFDMVSANNGTDASTDHSYVEIHNLGVANIERVEFVMGSAGPSKLVCSAGIDKDGNADYLDADWETENGGVYKNITVDGVANICHSSYSYDVPDYIENFDTGEEIKNARSKFKYVRLNWGKNFAGTTTNKKEMETSLYAIKVYTSADTSIPTGVEEEELNSLKIQMYGRNMQLSDNANVVIYNVFGKKVAVYEQIRNTYLDALDKGVYVICAKGNNGYTTTQKVIIR